MNTTIKAHRLSIQRVHAVRRGVGRAGKASGLRPPPPRYRQPSRRYSIEHRATGSRADLAAESNTPSSANRAMTLATKCRIVAVSTLARVSVGFGGRGLAMIGDWQKRRAALKAEHGAVRAFSATVAVDSADIIPQGEKSRKAKYNRAVAVVDRHPRRTVRRTVEPSEKSATCAYRAIVCAVVRRSEAATVATANDLVCIITYRCIFTAVCIIAYHRLTPLFIG